VPGTNAGTGYPLTLRCAKCKVSRSRWARTHSYSRGTNLLATGRTRPALRRGYRQTDRKIEYACQTCGHVGWSQHMDAERLLGARLAKIRTRHRRKWMGR
jgi:hypothetical protein